MICLFSPVIANDAASAGAYAERYLEARRTALRMSIETRRQIARVYESAADDAAKVVQDALGRGLSTLTSDRWAAIESKLRDAAKDISEGTEAAGIKLVKSCSSLFPELDADWLSKLARLAGADDRLTAAGFERIAGSISSRVVASLTSRLWSDGKNFSDRVWGKPGIQSDWFERIRSAVAGGIAQGRDPVKIAKDIQVYTADGRIALLQRWGHLVRGTAEFARRLPGRIDWRATRLVRSELSASLQDEAVMAGEANPATTGLYDWILQDGRQHWGCDCEDLAASGPYEADNVPGYPHSNCACYVRPRMRDQKKFIDDLKRWAAGGDVDYIDTWYGKTYKGAA
jgi:hypothetical protein